MEPNSIMFYYIVSFFALLIGIYLGVLAGTSIVNQLRNTGERRKNKLAMYYDKLTGSDKQNEPPKQEQPVPPIPVIQTKPERKQKPEKPEKQPKPPKPPKPPKLPKTPKTPKEPKMNKKLAARMPTANKPPPKLADDIPSMENQLMLDEPVTESLIAKRIVPKESYTETRAHMENADVSEVVKANQRNNTRQYGIMSRRKTEKGQNEE